MARVYRLRGHVARAGLWIIDRSRKVVRGASNRMNRNDRYTPPFSDRIHRKASSSHAWIQRIQSLTRNRVETTNREIFIIVLCNIVDTDMVNKAKKKRSNAFSFILSTFPLMMRNPRESRGADTRVVSFRKTRKKICGQRRILFVRNVSRCSEFSDGPRNSERESRVLKMKLPRSVDHGVHARRREAILSSPIYRSLAFPSLHLEKSI